MGALCSSSSRAEPYHADPGGCITRFNYKAAGVDIDAGDAFVRTIGPLAEATARPGVASGLGGFAALFDLKAAGYRDPILVAATDGVGTKVKIAAAMRKFDTVGVDLVAMCVNDLVVCGAEPLLFLDYYATGRLDPDVGRAIVEGVAHGCRLAGCALVGGETAEMPGVYAESDFDLAGFAVGALERGSVIGGETTRAGDVVVGLPSSGLHSNGFSLVRRVVADLGLDLQAAAPFDPDQSLGCALLTPTRIYVRAARAAIASGGVAAVAHITGGGLIENIPRVLPAGLAVELDARSWPSPPVFGWLQRTAGVAPEEMARAFNCGLGMVVIARASDAAAVVEALRGAGEAALEVGRVVERGEGEPRVRLRGLEAS